MFVPAVMDGIVYGGHNVLVVAIDAARGTQLWDSPLGQINTSVAASDGAIYYGSQDGNLYALNAKTGAFLWSFNTGVSIWCSPAVAKGVVYVGSDSGYLYAIDATTGSLRWKYPANGGIRSAPSLANGVVYFGGAEGNIYALDAASGALLWESSMGFIYRSPTVVDGRLFVTDEGVVESFHLPKPQ
jgi:outer membrane protein assembly factor BamB